MNKYRVLECLNVVVAVAGAATTTVVVFSHMRQRRWGLCARLWRARNSNPQVSKYLSCIGCMHAVFMCVCMPDDDKKAAPTRKQCFLRPAISEYTVACPELCLGCSHRYEPPPPPPTTTTTTTTTTTITTTTTTTTRTTPRADRTPAVAERGAVRTWPHVQAAHTYNARSSCQTFRLWSIFNCFCRMRKTQVPIC